ncbi:uncharacterized protein LOC110249972, partial [Exaiptasia diaphana]|uniref:Uncharacterized protein n=1 Tax=Exaiptasia diaphana TaxID=2652724 RepID=A0A913XYE4_EXADI
NHYAADYVEVSDANYEFKIRKCRGMRPFEVLIKNRPAVIRYHSDKGYWHRFSGVSVTFYIITQKLSDSTVNRWDPAIKQSKPGEVTIDWDHSTLPSKNYTVVPFYNYTTKGEPFLYIIEHRKETSMVTQHLNPGSSYSFKAIAFNSVNMRAALVVSSTTTVLMRNGT